MQNNCKVQIGAGLLSLFRVQWSVSLKKDELKFVATSLGNSARRFVSLISGVAPGTATLFCWFDVAHGTATLLCCCAVAHRVAWSCRDALSFITQSQTQIIAHWFIWDIILYGEITSHILPLHMEYYRKYTGSITRFLWRSDLSLLCIKILPSFMTFQNLWLFLFHNFHFIL